MPWGCWLQALLPPPPSTACPPAVPVSLTGLVPSCGGPSSKRRSIPTGPLSCLPGLSSLPGLKPAHSSMLTTAKPESLPTTAPRALTLRPKLLARHFHSQAPPLTQIQLDLHKAHCLSFHTNSLPTSGNLPDTTSPSHSHLCTFGAC